jgi:TonB family protein
MWRRSSVAWGVTASLLLHGAWMLTLQPPRQPGAALRIARPYSVAFDAWQPPTAPPAPLHASAVTLAGGPVSASALDLDQSAGRGGERAAPQPASLLFSFASPLTLQDTELNNLARSQTQRIETARTRATQEERRATPHAAAAVFLASGSGGHRERRAAAREDARDGAEQGTSKESWLDSEQDFAVAARAAAGQPSFAPEACAAAAEPDLLAPAAGGAREPVTRPAGQASEVASASQASSARGILRGRGEQARRSARVAHARPNVDPGPAATPAQTLDPRVRDNADAELLAAALQRSIVDSSTQRAEQRGPGAGGVEDPAAPGLSRAGIGRGARALPYLPGLGDASALDTRDARYLRWFVEQKERVQNELTFPKARALGKDQGVSIYRVVVRRDGQLAGAPHLVRSSGYADFDQAAVLAIRRAVPFSPLPERLVPEADGLTLLIPVAFSNPMVQ